MEDSSEDGLAVMAIMTVEENSDEGGSRNRVEQSKIVDIDNICEHPKKGDTKKSSSCRTRTQEPSPSLEKNKKNIPYRRYSLGIG